MRSLDWGPRTELTGGDLRVDREALLAVAADDPRLGSVTADIARPGESVRIVRVFDVIEPRCKTAGGSIFPGFLGPGRTVGAGRTVRLQGLALVTTADFPTEEFEEGPSTVNGPRERFFDMGGPGQDLCPFGATLNLVLSFSPAAGCSAVEFDRAVRLAGLRTAGWLAGGFADRPNARVERLRLDPPTRPLPRVVYVYQLQSHGLMRDTCLYGEAIPFIEPTLLHPNELADGAVVTASLSYAATSTYTHCNNRVVAGLRARHGVDLDFAGIVLTSYHHLTDFYKEKRAHMSAKLARLCGAQGAVITQEGAGNSIVDQMLTTRFLEEFGIRTVTVTYEMGGGDGRDVPLIYHVPEADALVSTGNREERVSLPAVARAIGGDRLLFSDLPATGPAETYTSDVAFAIDLTGYSRVRACAF